MSSDASKAAARDKLAALRNGFATRLRERVRVLEDAVEAACSRDDLGVRQTEALAHQLAGTAGSYGFVEVGELSAELEALCQAGFEPDAARAIIERLWTALGRP
ncbi:MAG: Hpt domain-containing protein [Nannocystales bacterium]